MSGPRLLEQHLADGTPLRLGELAQVVGYSREHIRKLADAGVVVTTEPHRKGVHRRVPPAEAQRFARLCGVLL